MTPDQRLERTERILMRLVKAGYQARRESRERSREQAEKIDILINTHMKNEEAWRAESHATNEKINVLIHTQMETGEQIKGLAVGQAKTDQALRGFINSLRKGQNGKSSD